MRAIIRKVMFHPGLALGSTLLWGILEFIALQRSNNKNPRTQMRQAHFFTPRNR